jgi:hypothetical protein
MRQKTFISKTKKAESKKYLKYRKFRLSTLFDQHPLFNFYIGFHILHLYAWILYVINASRLTLKQMNDWKICQMF